MRILLHFPYSNGLKSFTLIFHFLVFSVGREEGNWTKITGFFVNFVLIEGIINYRLQVLPS